MRYKDLFIDIDDTDIAGAINAGLDTIFFNRWNVDPKALDRQPDYIVDKLVELPTWNE